MKRLFWKIALIEGLFLVLILSATMWGMGKSHEVYESRRQEERLAAVELLKLAMQNDLSAGVSLTGLEQVASRLFKGDVHIVEPGKADDYRPEDTIRFTQGGTPYTLVITAPEHHQNDRGIVSFLLRDKYVATLLVLAVGLGLLAIPLARIVTQPLGELRRDMRKFASGNLDHRTKVTSRDEVGEVAVDFNKMAESIQSLVRIGSEMTAHVSHELRSPLTRIDVARQILEEQLTGQHLALLDSIREETEGMDNLIDRILRLSKLELDKRTPAPLCLAGIINESIRRHTASLKANGITLQRTLPDTFPGVGVRDDIACLIDNLFGNALKFTPADGSIEITLEHDGDDALLTITNDAEKPAVNPMRLTEPFQRGTVSESVPGSGLGLAIIERIVGNHGGGMGLSWAHGKFSAVIKLPTGDAGKAA